MPLRHLGERFGAIHLGHKADGFSADDEELLETLALEAALFIALSRRHRSVQLATADLDALVQTASGAVLVLDAATGDVRSVNREARRIMESLGIPDLSQSGLPEGVVAIRGGGREIVLDGPSLSGILCDAELVFGERVEIRGPGGESVAVLVNATPVRSGAGEVESLVVTMQDRTPVDELERQRAEFLGMVNRGLQAPLSTIKGSAATLLDESQDLDPADMRQFFRLIDREVDHMREMIGNLLDAARIESGTLPLNLEPADVAALVDQARPPSWPAEAGRTCGWNGPCPCPG